MTPIVAIVGRPNVGKSSLFNRLAGSSLAIVDDQPGATRDRHYADTLLHGRWVTLVDTGGLDSGTGDAIGSGIARQVTVAIEQADLVLCLLDGSEVPTELDRKAVALLRRSGKPVLFVANKTDRQGAREQHTELFSLGLPDLIGISAIHGRGIDRLTSAMIQALPEAADDQEPADPSRIGVAILGKPNAGKSSLLNAVLGEERCLVTAIPGTTRDPVDALVSFQGQTYRVIDTAGIRRRSRVDAKGIEATSIILALRVMERAQVVILLCDATQGVTEQDQRLVGMAVERGRAVVVGLNKVDMLDNAGRRASRQQAEEALRFASWVTLCPVSALTGKGVKDLMRAVSQAARQLQHRVPTAELNRFFEKVIAAHPPPTRGGKAPRLYYFTQAGTAPPLFVAISNAPQHIAPSYARYLANQIRKAFGFESVPILLRFRAKERGARGGHA